MYIEVYIIDVLHEESHIHRITMCSRMIIRCEYGGLTFDDTLVIRCTCGVPLISLVFFSNCCILLLI